MSLLVLAYGLFAAGFMALLGAIAGRERLADVMNTMTAMGLGLVGGCMFPVDPIALAGTGLVSSRERAADEFL